MIDMYTCFTREEKEEEKHSFRAKVTYFYSKNIFLTITSELFKMFPFNFILFLDLISNIVKRNNRILCKFTLEL